MQQIILLQKSQSSNNLKYGIQMSTNTKQIANQSKIVRTMPIKITSVRAMENPDGSQKTVYDCTFSTEQPVERFDWYSGKTFKEILSHDPASVDLSRCTNGMPILFEHDSMQQIGIGTNIAVDGEKKTLTGSLRFSKSAFAQEIEQDVVDGIRTSLSIGYVITEYTVDESVEPAILTATKWMPYEGSIVSIPADVNAGVGRNAQFDFAKVLHTDEELKRACATDKQNMRADSENDPNEKESATEQANADSPATQEAESEDAQTTSVDEASEQSAGTETDPATETSDSEKEKENEMRKSVDKLSTNQSISNTNKRGFSMSTNQNPVIALCKQLGVSAERTMQFVESGTSVDGVKDALLAERSAGNSQLAGLSGADAKAVAKKYSYARAFQSVVDTGSLSGIEAEVAQELAKTTKAQRGGFLVPLSTRAFGTDDVPNDQAFLQKQVGDPIQRIRVQSKAISLGATVYDNLMGEMKLPKFDGDTEIQWLGEKPAQPGGFQSLTSPSLVSLNPTLATSNHQITLDLLRNNTSVFNADAQVRDSIAYAVSRGIDKAAFRGTGTNKQPLGIAYTPGVLTKAFGNAAPTYGDIIEMLSDLYGSMQTVDGAKFATTRQVAAYLKQTLTNNTAANAGYLWNGTFDNGDVAGYPATVAGNLGQFGNAEDEQGFILGLWDNLLIGLGGATEIVVDPYSQKRNAMIEYTAYTYADVAVKRAEAFVVATGLKIS